MILRDGPTTATTHIDALVDLYADVFAEPPYCEGPEQVARFRVLLIDEMDRPGFAVVRAVDHGTLVGMAYGFTIPAEQWWHDAATSPPPAAIGVAKFAIMELAVRQSHRGQGLGRELLGDLLRGRTEPIAFLGVDPAAPAYAIYRKWGWREAGHTVPKSGRSYAILLIDLPPR
ncbi:GNAT family N-acetyltransferase [Nocardia iowensis]|uniref:GNAT family N-acetyltransferase n=1 Tax=Nocardia iowensis TaxID=204891 RepID=A0ABX8RG87_NOCIO|nr:GNAT family N-acetyltransferase [Nocardia iowensis]QXN88628.1 GNAT family N-acetyltransferase [Nocardia iowensis]